MKVSNMALGYLSDCKSFDHEVDKNVSRALLDGNSVDSIASWGGGLRKCRSDADSAHVFSATGFRSLQLLFKSYPNLTILKC